jgi:uncharacterized protein
LILENILLLLNKKVMKILITGATGLVGSELSSLLLKNGIQVHYLTTSQKKISTSPNYSGFYWNPQKGIIDENALMGVDAIIHLAGASVSKRWTNAYKQEIIESRILTANLLYKALKNNPHQVKQIISASGTGIYPDSLTEIYTEENTEVDNGFLGNVVVKWEESVDKFKQLNINVCKMRTGIVLSTKGGALPEILTPIKLGIGSPIGTGNQIQSWIHVQDLAAMYLFAAQNDLKGTFNAVSPNAVSNKTLTETLAHQLKKPLFMPKVPKFLMKLLLGEMHTILFSSQNASAKKIISQGFSFKFPKIESAIENLL